MGTPITPIPAPIPTLPGLGGLVPHRFDDAALRGYVERTIHDFPPGHTKGIVVYTSRDADGVIRTHISVAIRHESATGVDFTIGGEAFIDFSSRVAVQGGIYLKASWP